ncbi:hypothetical protein CfE428DRAFT_2058 [Chthoniobacter flavus Ellin428]|uniref:Clp domain protein n=1 Tax=Chthoniobacter flavus Ellin428 TaxID=497964 RepID=B4CZH0_9BACT|nr:Clp protease N-terminal domain-containing protein [Chthoniobacter flavus]EDY20134.1 hypothetical protein CfE428DRAFT_2058 [Chthoniobacter flavus Ellin428]TCO94033.1 ClpA/ClpB-like protein [Chthoniobacter flavus]
MKVRHSESLILIWQLARLEAGRLRAATIEPNHLLLALCKSVDLDLLVLVSKDAPNRDEVLEELLREVRRLRTIFKTVGLDARSFRHALRSRSGSGDWNEAVEPTSSLHRSPAAKQVFAEAGHLAELSGLTVFPVQLLCALLANEDRLRDGLLRELGVEPERLRQAVQREILPAGKRLPPGQN